MPVENYTLFHVSATRANTPTIITNHQTVPSTDALYGSIKDILDCNKLGIQRYELWCIDGVRYGYHVFWDEDGRRPKLLEPNHRANAMVDAGRFISTEFNYIDDESPNQQMKEAQGSNYFFGDIVIFIGEGDPRPDVSIYGQNPVKFITTVKTPSAEMIANHGKRFAFFKTHFALTQEINQTMFEATDRLVPEDFLSIGDMSPRIISTIYKQYLIAPPLQSGGSYNRDFVGLLSSWGLLEPDNPHFSSVRWEMNLFRETGYIGNIYFPNHSNQH